MRRLVKKFLPLLLSVGLIYYILNFVQAPSSWTDASIYQILSIFISLLLFLTFLNNLFIGYLTASFLIGLGAIFIIALKSVSDLNNYILSIVISAFLILIIVFIKNDKKIFNPFKKSLTMEIKIPKLKNLKR